VAGAVAKLDLPVAKDAAEYGPVKPSQTQSNPVKPGGLGL
jgi:hypothetical protein